MKKGSKREPVVGLPLGSRTMMRSERGLILSFFYASKHRPDLTANV